MAVMQGKRVLVTGATGGIGKVAARELAQMGAELILVGRSAEKCAAVQQELREATGSDAIHYMVADLSSQAAICSLAEEFHVRYDRLDVLLNNAGAVNVRREESVDGIEMTFALNHLNYFLLTYLLLPALRRAPSARIVNVASAAHHTGSMNLSDPEFKQRRFNGIAAYSQSKLANILFTYELARRLQGTRMTANALHPGFVASRFATNNGALFRFVPLLARLVGVNEEQGARTSVYLAASPEVEGVSGAYYAEGKLARSNAASYDTTTQRALWELSAQMTGVPAELS